MTKAICWECGCFKEGCWIPCPKCNADPITDDDKIISLFLSDHYQDEKSLNALHIQITSGSKNYFIPNDVKEKLKPILKVFPEKNINQKFQDILAINQFPSKRVGLFKKLVIFISLYIFPGLAGTLAFLLSGQIFLIIEKIIPFSDYFQDLYYLAVDFTGGIIFSYFLFWSGAKIANSLLINTTLFFCSFILLGTLFPQLRTSIYTLDDPSYGIIFGSLLVAFNCWIDNKYLRYLVPKIIIDKKFKQSTSRSKDLVPDKFIKEHCLENQDIADIKKFYAAWNLYLKGDYENAFRSAEEIYLKNPTFISACLIIGTVKFSNNDIEGSLKFFDILINSGLPFSSVIKKNAYFLRGRGNYKIKNFTLALEDFLKCLELNKNDLKVMQQISLAKIRLKKFADVIQDIEEFLILYPNELYLLELEGIAYINLKRYDIAIEIFDKLLNDLPSSNKQDASYNFYLSEIYYYQLNNLTMAKKYILDAFKLDPENILIQDLLSKINNDLNHP